MKNIQIMLALATLSLAACDGLSDDDIRMALNNAEPAQASHLQFRAGETWTGTRTEREVFGIPYKYEKGKATLCEQGEASNSATRCGSPSSGVNTKTTQVNATVLGKSDTASTQLPGWAVQEVNTVVQDVENFYAAAGTYTEVNDPLTSTVTTLYTLAEHGNFVVRLDENVFDVDASKGDTLYPSHPQRGRSYTDDAGISWTVTSTTRVTLASGKASGAAISAATAPEALTDLANLTAFKEKCFYKMNQGGSTYSVEIRDDCTNTLTVKFELTAEVGYDLALRQRVYVERMDITDYGVRDAGGNLSQNLPDSVTGDFVFLYEISSEEETFTMTDIKFP